MRWICTLFLLAGLTWGGPAAPEAAAEEAAARPRQDDYAAAMARARGWLDGLHIDWRDLTVHGVKGKKKLSEILESYLILHRHAKDPGERARIMERVGGLVEQTRQPGYHNMTVCSGREFNNSSMAYLHVASLMHDFGFDNAAYVAHIHETKARLDRHFLRRKSKPYRGSPTAAELLWGVWPLVRFAQFYDRFELDKPSILRDATLEQGVIQVRYPLKRYDKEKAYELTHEVLIAFDWGRSKTQDYLDADDLAYAREALSALTLRFIEEDDVDLVSSLVTDLAYLGRQDDPTARAGLDYILDEQNEDGSWGDYESHRRQWAHYLEAHAYLHTTLVSLRALSAAYEGDWPTVGE